jgi:serine/threonine protein kinase
LLVIAGLTGRWLDQSRKDRVAVEARRLAADAERRVHDAWAAQTESLALLTSSAGSNPLLMTALRGGVDGATLADIARNEEWWAPYRSASAALSYVDTALAFTQDVESAPQAAAVVATVRQERRPVVRTFLAPGGHVVLMSGEPIRYSTQRSPAVLVLQKRIDDGALAPLAARTHAPVLVADERGVLAASGQSQDLFWLRTVVGHHLTGRRAGRDWAALATPLSQHLWMWTGASAAEFARLLAGADARKERLLWVLAAMAAAVALFGTWRGDKRAAAGAAASVPAHAGVPAAHGSGSTSGQQVSPEDILPPSRVPQSLVRRPIQGGVQPPAPLPQLGSLQPPPLPQLGSLQPPPLPQLGSFPVSLSGRSANAGVGITLGRYFLVDRIGEGGMAEVFTAVSLGAGGFRRFFVVKRLRPEMNSNPVAVAHFIDEANLASTLVHPNIVPVFDFGEIGGTYFLAQEYVVGRDLGRLRRRMIERGERSLSPRAIFFLAHELLAGLQCAHDQRDDDGSALELVHRDVTPENVMISERGEVKLLDFGIVKVGNERANQTEIGHLKGNVDFMSPEHARGDAVDRRADLFSVGLVLYYAATGRPLYQGNTLFDRLSRAAAGPGPEDWAKIAALPPPLGEMLRRALAVEPDDRYQTAIDFRAVVAPLMEGGDAELSSAVSRNFDRELRAEQDRLTSAFPRARSHEPSIAASEGETEAKRRS